MIISQKTHGWPAGRAYAVLPPNALLITRLDNLSIYWQEDTRRRSVIDNPKRDRIENFESVNEALRDWDHRCAASGGKTSRLATSSAAAAKPERKTKSLSPARQHRLRVQAEQAAREGGSVRHASGYDLMLLQLAEDRRRLRAFSPR